MRLFLLPMLALTMMCFVVGPVVAQPHEGHQDKDMSKIGPEQDGDSSYSLQPAKNVPLEAGKEATVRFKVIDLATNEALGPRQLKLVHTEKLHGLVVDQTLTDYFHVHPKFNSKDGTFSFSFTPMKKGDYRMWADITPVKTGRQVYPIMDIESAALSDEFVNRELDKVFDVDGLRFVLSFEEEPQVGVSTRGVVFVTEADGNPFIQLQEVMESYAHVVAFNEDRETIAHVHPVTSPVKGKLGGPMIEFQFMPEVSGYTKIYAQFRIGGKDVFVPFGIDVGS